jgi:hypothetical protein
MQKSKRDMQRLSRYRQELLLLLDRLEHSVKAVLGRSPIVKGNVYEMARKCGKSSCVCNRGELHRSMVLSWSEKGKTGILSIPSERLVELQKKSEEYLLARNARAQVSTICKQIVGVMDHIEKLRLEEP